MIEFENDDHDMEVMDSKDDLIEDNQSGIVQTKQIVQLNASIVLSYYHCIRLDANTELEMILNIRNSRRGSCNSNVGTNCAIDGSDEETNLHQGDGPTNSQCPSLKFNSNIRNIAESNPEIYFLILSGECQSFGTQLIPKNLYRFRSEHRYQFQTFTGFELCFLTCVQQQSVELIVKYQNLSSSNFKRSNTRPNRTSSNLNSTIELKRNRFSKLDCTFPLTDDLDIDDICDMVMNSQLECNEEQESKCRPSSPKRLSKLHRGEGNNPKSINDADSLTNLRENLNDSGGGGGGGRDSIRINCTVKSFRQSSSNISNPSSSSGSSSSLSSSWLYRSYVKFAERLNRLREMAASTNKPGPNVMIIGPCDSGKSSLAKMLVNYATGDGGGYSPIYVDLDVGQGSIGVPGMIGAGVVDQQSSIDQETFQYRSNSSIIIHFGSVTPGNDPLLHRLSVGCLERNISNLIQQDQIEYQRYQESSKDETRSKIKNEPKKMLTKWSGLVVNTHGWTFDYGYESTLDAAKQFNISHICVLGDYRLFDRIYRDLNNGQVPGQSSSRDNRRGTWNRRNQTNSSRNNSQRSSSQADNSIEILFFQPNLSTIKRSNRLRRKLRFDRFEHYFSPRSLVDLDNNPDRMTTVLVPFGEHSIFRFYLKSDRKFLNLLNGESDPTVLTRKPSEIVYLTLKIRKTKRKLNDEAIFYHLDSEVLVYLRNRILSIMEISSKKLLSKSCVDQRSSSSSSSSDSHFYWFSLRELLAVRGLARITQVDMENEQLEIQLPYRFSELLNEQKLVFLLNETNFDEDDEEFC